MVFVSAQKVSTVVAGCKVQAPHKVAARPDKAVHNKLVSMTLGEEIFSNNCAACHTGGQNIVQVERTLQKPALEQYLDGGLSEASIVTQATNGKGAMPAFGDSLSEEEIQAVASYVYNQATNDLW
eukprot:jgi/Picre1/29710/NNA_005093.t1